MTSAMYITFVNYTKLFMNKLAAARPITIKVLSDTPRLECMCPLPNITSFVDK